MSEFRVEKRRAPAALTLSTGTTVRGFFFLAGSRANLGGPERVADLLNDEGGFFPFELSTDESPHTVLYNRSQLIVVTLLDGGAEARLEPGYAVATERDVRMLLSNGERLDGRVRVYRPSGHDRLSDYARASEMFRYLETEHETMLVNTSHIVELRETTLP